MSTPPSNDSRSPAQEIFNALLAPAGGFLLFLAGLTGAAMLSVLIVSPTAAMRSSAFGGILAGALLAAILGAALYRLGHNSVASPASPQHDVRRFAGNVLLAIGLTWTAVSGVCTLWFYWNIASTPTNSAGAVAVWLIPPTLGAALGIAGWVLRRPGM